MRERVMSIPAVVADRVVRGRVAADMLLVIGSSALIAIAAQVAIPLSFTPVPMTLQPLAVLFLGAALGSTRGAAPSAPRLRPGRAAVHPRRHREDRHRRGTAAEGGPVDREGVAPRSCGAAAALGRRILARRPRPERAPR